MRPAPEPVKLRIAHVSPSRDRFRRSQEGNAAHLAAPLKTPQNLRYSASRRIWRERIAQLTKRGGSRISRANCPRWPGLTGAAHLGRKRLMFGPAFSDLPH